MFCRISIRFDGVFLFKFLFGLPHDFDGASTYLNGKFDTAHELIEKIDNLIDEADFLWTSIGKVAFHQVGASNLCDGVVFFVRLCSETTMLSYAG